MKTKHKPKSEHTPPPLNLYRVEPFGMLPVTIAASTVHQACQICAEHVREKTGIDIRLSVRIESVRELSTKVNRPSVPGVLCHEPQ